MLHSLEVCCLCQHV